MVRRFRTLWILLALTLASVAARADDYTVFIYDYYFSPTNITVAPGDSITWINKGLQPHDTTANVGTWASPLLYNDEEFFAFTFTQVGPYPYVCQAHVADFPQQTGLVVVASIDLPPSVLITSPANGSVRAAPANITISADASDSNGAITRVEFFVNSNSVAVFLQPPFTTNLTGLGIGQYFIAAVATDNMSVMATNAVSITVQEFEPTNFTLRVLVEPTNTGAVFVTPPGENGVYLAGTTVALAAQPAAGFRFVEWTGVDANASMNNPLLLVMDTDKTVAATFEPVPPLVFSEVAGVFAGLLIDERTTNYTTSGLLSVRVSKTGRYSGTSTIGGIRQLIAGQFDRFGYAPLVLRRGSLSGSLQMDVARQRMTGSLTGGSNSPSPTLLLYRTAAKTNAAAALAGNYPVVFAAQFPVLSPGTASMQVLSKGNVLLHGTLGDGTAFSERTILSPDGRVPIYVPLYYNRGAMLGWLTVAEGGPVQGTMRWFRPGDSRNLKYPQGFALKIPVDGSPAE